MKKGQKSPIDTFKKLLQSANIFKESQPKIYYAVQKFVMEKISSEMKANPQSLTDQDRKAFEVIVKDMLTQKKQAGGNEFYATKEEYLDFITNLFANIDDEERNEEIEIKVPLASKFLLCSEFIDVLELYGLFNDEWKKTKKYCKFKSVEIMKALKSGEPYKRGNPNKEEDELAKDLNNMIEEQGNKDQVQQQGQGQQGQVVQSQQQDFNNQGNTYNNQTQYNQGSYQGNNQFQQQGSNQGNNQYQGNNQGYNQFNQQGNYQGNNQFQQQGQQGGQGSNQGYNQFQQGSNQGGNNQFQQGNNQGGNNQFQQGQQGNNQEQQGTAKSSLSNFHKKDVTKSPRFQPSSTAKSSIHDYKLKEPSKSSSGVDANKTKILDLKYPIKKKSIDFFKVIEQVKKHVTWGGDALKNSRTTGVSTAMQHIEAALFYLDNVAEN